MARMEGNARNFLLRIRLTGIAIICAGYGGCTNVDTPPLSENRPMPPMPTMGAPRDVAETRLSEDDIVAASLKAALDNNVPGALMSLDLASEPNTRASASTKLVSALAKENAETASTLALALPLGPARSAAIEIAALARFQRAPADALQWALGINDAASANIVRRTIARELVQTNPLAAIARVKALPSGSARNDLLTITAAAWARRDPDGALSWMQGQPDDALRQRLASSMAFEIAQISPAQAIDVAETLPLGRDRWLVISEIAKTWVAQNRNAAESWANQLPVGEARDAALAGINAGSGASTSRARDITAVASVTRDSRPHSAYLVGAASDPPGFTTWLATQPLPMSRDEAIIEYVRQRGSQDLGAIGTWITGLAGDPARARAMDIYFEEVLRSSPMAAANWLRSLPSSDRSNEMIEKIARQLRQTDPGGATAWLRELSLLEYQNDTLNRYR